MFRTFFIVLFVYIAPIVGTIVYALQSYGSDIDLLPETPLLTACNITQNEPAVIISEIGFDGTDERIEITNISNQEIVDAFTILGGKSKPLIISGIKLAPGESVVLGDALADDIRGNTLLSGGRIFTGMGLSMPDTTGFTLQITSETYSINYVVSFSSDHIKDVPDGNTLSVIGNITDGIVDFGSDFVSTIPTPGKITCFLNNIDENGEESAPDGAEATGGVEETGVSNTPLLDDSNVSTSPDIYNAIITSGGSTTGVPDVYMPIAIPNCLLTEVYAIPEQFPEYIEIRCDTVASGNFQFLGLGAGSSVKSLNLAITTGGYVIITTTYSGFVDTGNIVIVSGISLLDAGETIIMQQSGSVIFASTFPPATKGHSFYSACETTSSIVCTTPSPGFNHRYGNLYVPQTAIPYSSSTNTNSSIETLVSCKTPSPSTTGSLYYQDLYQKRKTTAKDHEKTISMLKKQVTSLSGSLTRITATLLKTETNLIKEKEKKTPVCVKKQVVGSTTTTSSASSSTSKAKTVSTTSKAKTVSTTSKAYVLLTNEHKLYKEYINFIHSYLKSRLYKQFDTLQIPGAQSLLKKSLQTLKENNTMLSYTGGQTISVFDFEAQWKIAHDIPPSTDKIFLSLIQRYKKFVQTKEASALQSYFTLFSTVFGGKKFTNDTGNDTTAIKTSETNF